MSLVWMVIVLRLVDWETVSWKCLHQWKLVFGVSAVLEKKQLRLSLVGLKEVGKVFVGLG